MKMTIRNIFFGFSIVVMLLTIVIIIPIIINEAYKTGEGYYTVWNGADALAFYGSILSFIGTAFISIIALYQNKKFKEENDKTQKRTEEISIRANELNSINIIIEYEIKQLNDIEILLNEFEKATNIQNVGINLNKESNILISAAKIENTVDNLLFVCSNEIRKNFNVCPDSRKKLSESMWAMYSIFKNMIENIKSNKPDNKISEEEIDKYTKQWDVYMNMKNLYLYNRKALITKVLYEDLSLAEVKKLFSKSTKEENDNG